MDVCEGNDDGIFVEANKLLYCFVTEFVEFFRMSRAFISLLTLAIHFEKCDDAAHKFAQFLQDAYHVLFLGKALHARKLVWQIPHAAKFKNL